jgi:hypothetical protein
VDENKPTVSVNRKSHNTFSYVADDNLGITKWAVVVDSTDKPTSWEALEKTTTHLEGIYELTSAGTHYFWISDANGNTAFATIVAYPIQVETTPGITSSHYFFTEEGENFTTPFATSGTVLRLNVTPDEHYENLSINISTAVGDISDNTFVVSKAVDIILTCTPKNYAVTFNLGGKGDSTKAPQQTITYLHKATKPFEQYYQLTSEIIGGWYVDPEHTVRWDFETMVIEHPMELYAKWEPYSQPSVLTVQIPEGSSSVRTITVAYSQYNVDSDHKVLIEWGDGEKYSSNIDNADPRYTPIHVTHTNQ